MRKSIFVLACILSTSALAIETPRGGEQAAGTTTSSDTIRVAQACGWYAIYSCSRSRGDAQRIANEFGGRVINTSRDEYPNFQPGYFCTVVGPMARSAAVAQAARLRSTGVARDAYAKNAC